METTWPYFNLAVVLLQEKIRVSSCAATPPLARRAGDVPSVPLTGWKLGRSCPPETWLNYLTETTGNVVKLSHRNVAKLGGWDRILDAMGGMHWSSVSYPTPT